MVATILALIGLLALWVKTVDEDNKRLQAKLDQLKLENQLGSLDKEIEQAEKEVQDAKNAYSSAINNDNSRSSKG